MLGGRHATVRPLRGLYLFSPELPHWQRIPTALLKPLVRKVWVHYMSSLCLSHCVLVATLCTLSFLLLGMGQRDSCLGSSKTKSNCRAYPEPPLCRLSYVWGPALAAAPASHASMTY